MLGEQEAPRPGAHSWLHFRLTQGALKPRATPVTGKTHISRRGAQTSVFYEPAAELEGPSAGGWGTVGKEFLFLGKVGA